MKRPRFKRGRFIVMETEAYEALGVIDNIKKEGGVRTIKAKEIKRN
jgi:hypothetical protein